jgi:hypothetical protein
LKSQNSHVCRRIGISGFGSQGSKLFNIVSVEIAIGKKSRQGKGRVSVDCIGVWEFKSPMLD